MSTSKQKVKLMKELTAKKILANKIYALYDNDTIRVYQAYNDIIANEAIKSGTFGASFNMDRMTWIKPSFLWMMYRSGWATKLNSLSPVEVSTESLTAI
nr:DUF4291 family protein [Lacrimispora sp.]